MQPALMPQREGRGKTAEGQPEGKLERVGEGNPHDRLFQIVKSRQSV